MKANTAVCFVLCGIAFLLVSQNPNSRVARFAPRIVGLLVFVISSLTFVECIHHLNIGIDQLLFKDDIGAILTSSPGRMAATSAISFMLISMSLIIFDARIKKQILPDQILALFAFLFSLISLFGYLFSQWGVLHIVDSTYMALHTALLFLILSTGIVISRPLDGFMKGVTNENGGGFMLRYLIPTIILFPLVIELLTTLGVNLGLIDINLKQVFRSLMAIVILMILAWAGTRKYDQAEKRLKQSEEKFRNVFENSPVGKSITGVDGSLHVNKSFCDILGYTEEELKSKKWQEITHHDDIKESDDIILSLVNGEKSQARYEKRYIHKNGNIVWTDINTTLQRDNNNQPLFFITIINDITLKKDVERRIVMEKQYTDQLIDSLPGLFYQINPEGKFVRWNKNFEIVSGYSSKEMENISPTDLFEGEEKRSISENIQKVFTFGSTTVEANFVSKDGTKTPYYFSGKLITINEQSFLAGMGIDSTEMNRARQEIQISQHHLAQSQIIAQLGNFEWDAVQDKITGSDEFFRLFSVNRDQLSCYSQFNNLLHDQDRERVGKDVAESIKTKKTYDTEYRILLPDGNYKFIHAKGEVFTDDNNIPVQMIGTCQDITARKVEEEIRDRLIAIIEQSADFIGTSDMQGNLLYHNPAAKKMIGLSEESSMDGMKIEDLCSERFLELVFKEGIPTAVKDGKWQSEIALKHADGHEVPVSHLLMVHKNPEGIPIYTSTVMRDITNLKQAEEAIRESEERFRTMADSMPQLAWVAHADGFIYWYNRRWYEYTGTKPVQMEGWGWQIVHDPEVLPKVMEKWTGSIATGKPFEMSFPLRGADGRFRTFLTRVEPWKNQDGKIIQWFGTNTDVETLKEAEEKIRELNENLEKKVVIRTEELQTANSELEAFSYSVSHDLRAPIRAIDGFTRRLSDNYNTVLDDEGKRLLEVVLRNTKNMGQLIDDLLSFSRLNRQKLETSRINMKELFEETVEEIKEASIDRKLEITIKNIPPANGDKALVRQVIVNLLSNASKFTRPMKSPVIEIGNIIQKNKTVYYVKDNGVGFSMKYVNKIFDVFQRLHSTKEFEGTGVGLAIVQRIINRHGGKVWAEAEINNGATFYFSLSE